MLPSDPGTIDQTRVALLKELLGAVGEGDSWLRAMVLARLAWELHCSENDERRD
jgi:hypothetical protein